MRTLIVMNVVKAVVELPIIIMLPQTLFVALNKLVLVKLISIMFYNALGR